MKKEFFIENMFTFIFMSSFFITNLFIVYGLVKLFFYVYSL
jgi:hypothetical protein